MGQEPRKATDVLVELESKVDVLLDIVRAQDLNIKILSNKLNSVMEQLSKAPATPPKITVEAVQAKPPVVIGPDHPANPFVQMPAADPERAIPIPAESKLPDTSKPQGFRRNSRPETYAGDNAVLPHGEQEHRMPMQLPKAPPGRGGEVIVPPPPGRQPQQTSPQNQPAVVVQPPGPRQPPQIAQQPTQPKSAGAIPVMQRVVDKNSKSVFLADVEITDLSTNQQVFKTRTNGTGKWMASLGIGAYREVVRKRESLTKEKIEALQDIQVDGTQSPLELPLMIIK